MAEGGPTQPTEVFAKYVMVIIIYIFCFYNLFNKDDPYGLYLVMVSLLIITILFGIFLTMDVEKYGLYMYIKKSAILSWTSLIITSSIILNFVSIAIFIAVFDSSRKYVKDKDNKITDTKPHMVSKMSNYNEKTFSIFKNKLMISTILIFCILSYFVFMTNSGSNNISELFVYSVNSFENVFIVINMVALFTIMGFLLYNTIIEIIYSSYFLKNKERNIDIYPVII
jgi:phosphate/sulfate permease